MSFKCRACKEHITDLDERTCEICGFEGCKNCIKKIDIYNEDGICWECNEKIKYDIKQKMMF